MIDTNNAEIIGRVCRAISAGDLGQAAQTIRDEYPFTYVKRSRPGISKTRALRLFLRDRFTDRYTGQRLLFPPVLSVISYHMPETFPSHSNWKMSETHQAYWELWPMLDHVIPIAQGGDNGDDNLVSTSPLTNARKAQFTPEEVGLTLIDPADLPAWDGLLGWFLDYAKAHPSILDAKVPGASIKGWFSAAQAQDKNLYLSSC